MLPCVPLTIGRSSAAVSEGSVTYSSSTLIGFWKLKRLNPSTPTVITLSLLSR